MKKIIIIILVSILVLAAATSIISPFIDTDKNSSNRNDENIEEVSFFEMFAGDNVLEEGVITVDGFLDDEYVNITPSSGISKGLTKAVYNGITEAAAISENQEDLNKSSNIFYYVAQTEEKIYLMIKDIGGYWGDGANEFITRNNYFLRLGIDSSDYTNSAVITIPVNGNSAISVSRMADATVAASPTVNFVTASSVHKHRIDENGDLILPGVAGNKNMSERYYGFIELELDKALMLEAFNNNDSFTCAIQAFPNEMFIGLSTQSYSWTDDSKSSIETIFYTWYGSILTAEEKLSYKAETVLVPDKIVFGVKK